MAKGNKGHSTKSVMVQAFDLSMNYLQNYDSITIASELTGIPKKQIIANIDKDIYSVKGMIWKKVGDVNVSNTRDDLNLLLETRQYAYDQWIANALLTAMKKNDPRYELNMDEIEELIERDSRTSMAFNIWCLRGLQYGYTVTITKYLDGDEPALRLSVSKKLKELVERFNKQMTYNLFDFVRMVTGRPLN